MRTIRTIYGFGLYLLPASLLTTAGLLLAALLYDPAPTAAPSNASQATVAADREYWRSHTEAMLAAMVADTLRQIREEQDGHVRTLQYRYESALPSAACPTMPRHGGGVADHPALVRL